MQDSTPVPALTPSEVVFLARDRFAPPAGRLSYYRSAGIEIKTSIPELAQQAYAAAFLAAERAGLLDLNVRSKKVMLGLRTVDALYADPTGGADAFPGDCLENRLHQTALGLSAKQQQEVWRVVYGIWSSDSSNPHADAVGQVQNLMASRGVLTSTSTKRLKVFTVVSHSEPTATVAAATAKAGEVQALLQECQTVRPNVWKHLVEGIAKGIRKHEKDDSADSDD